LRHEKSVQAQHVETLIDLRWWQPRIQRDRDAAARYCHDGEYNLRAIRHEHPDPGAAIEPSQTQLPAEVVQLALKISVRQRRKLGGDDRSVPSQADQAPAEPIMRANSRSLGTNSPPYPKDM